LQNCLRLIKMKKKLLQHGFCVIRNEELGIRGWAKLNLMLCDHVYAIIDPTTTDKTEEILRTEFPEIEILYQDRHLGDSDYNKEGRTKSLIMHNNLTQFVTDRIQEGEWFATFAADERIALESIPQLLLDIEYAQKHCMGAVCHERLYDVLPIHESKIIRDPSSLYFVDTSKCEYEPNLFNYVLDFHNWTLRHGRIECKTPNWKKNPEPHSGYSERYNPLISEVPLWHFHRIKHNQINPTDWRDGLGGLEYLFKTYKGKLPIMPMRIPFDNWAIGLEYTPPKYLVHQQVYEANRKYQEIYLARERNKQELQRIKTEQEKNAIRLKNKEDRDRYIALGKYYQEHFDKEGNEVDV
jgi:hypothetical protein